MTPARQRKAAEPAEAPKIQDRPAAPARKKAPSSEPPADDFPPNPVPPVKAGAEKPTERELKVTGPKEVGGVAPGGRRSEEHTSELQSPCNLVCRPLRDK